MLSMVIAPSGISDAGAQHYHFVTGQLDTDSHACRPRCPYSTDLLAPGETAPSRSPAPRRRRRRTRPPRRPPPRSPRARRTPARPYPRPPPMKLSTTGAGRSLRPRPPVRSIRDVLLVPTGAVGDEHWDPHPPASDAPVELGRADPGPLAHTREPRRRLPKKRPTASGPSQTTAEACSSTCSERLPSVTADARIGRQAASTLTLRRCLLRPEWSVSMRSGSSTASYAAAASGAANRYEARRPGRGQRRPGDRREGAAWQRADRMLGGMAGNGTSPERASVDIG